MLEEKQLEMLEFFKALSDANRLAIISMLAHKPYSVEHLAEAIGLGVSTTSHHLAKLSKANLVSARTDGHYYIYSLRKEVIQTMAQKMLQEDTFKQTEPVSSEDMFTRKVMKVFTDEAGQITAFPAQEKKLLVLLRYVLQEFKPGVKYTEKQVNEIISRFNPDTAFIRRSFIIYKMMDRETGGGAYWRIDEEK